MNRFNFRWIAFGANRVTEAGHREFAGSLRTLRHFR